MKEFNKRELILVEYAGNREVLDSSVLDNDILRDVTCNFAFKGNPLQLAYHKYVKGFTDNDFKFLTEYINRIKEFFW